MFLDVKKFMEACDQTTTTLNEEQANAKKHKAKFDRNKRVNHNKEYYELLGYSLYITNELITNYSSKKVTQIYGLRWRIENIFKCWKSQFHLQKIIDRCIASFMFK